MIEQKKNELRRLSEVGERMKSVEKMAVLKEVKILCKPTFAPQMEAADHSALIFEKFFQICDKCDIIKNVKGKGATLVLLLFLFSEDRETVLFVFAGYVKGGYHGSI